MEKPIKLNAIRKILKLTIAHISPPPKKILLLKTETEIDIKIISQGNEDITSAFITKHFIEDIPLYSILKDRINQNPKIREVVKNGFIYSHKASYTSKIKSIFNADYIRRITSVEDNIDRTLDKLNMSKTTYCNIINNINLDYSTSSMLKICKAYNKSPFSILSKENATMIFENMVHELISILTPEDVEILDKIKQHYRL